MIGWMPAADAVMANSMAANMLLVSVTATAGMPWRRHSSGSSRSLIAPSRSE